MESVSMRTRSKRKIMDFEGLPSQSPRKRTRHGQGNHLPMRLNYDILTGIADQLPDGSRLNLLLADKALYFSNRRRFIRDNFFRWRDIWKSSSRECHNHEHERCAWAHAIIHDNADVLKEALSALDCKFLFSEMPVWCVKAVVQVGIKNSSMDSLRILVGDADRRLRRILPPLGAHPWMLDTALSCDDVAVAKLLIDNCCLKLFYANSRRKPRDDDEDDDDTPSLMQRARSAAMVRLLADSGVPVDSPSFEFEDMLPYEGDTALHWHCTTLRTPQNLITALIESGSEVNQVILSFFHHAVDLPVHHRATALNLAASCLNLSAMRILLKAGADVGGGWNIHSERDSQWHATTPLHDVLDHAIREPGKCLWRFHLIVEAQDDDMQGKQEALEQVYPDPRFVEDEYGFGCSRNLCGHHADPDLIHNDWFEQVKLLSQRMLAAVRSLLAHGAHNYVNVPNLYEKTPLECLVQLVYAILTSYHHYRWPSAPRLRTEWSRQSPIKWAREAAVLHHLVYFGTICDLLIELGAEIRIPHHGFDCCGVERLLQICCEFSQGKL